MIAYFSRLMRSVNRINVVPVDSLFSIETILSSFVDGGWSMVHANGIFGTTQNTKHPQCKYHTTTSTSFISTGCLAIVDIFFVVEGCG
jgi:hypothetical protein